MKYKSQTGGIVLNDKIMNYKIGIQHFLNNSEIQYLDKGSSGLIFKASLKNDITESPFFMIRPNNHKYPVRNLIIKLAILHNIQEPYVRNQWQFVDYTEQKEKNMKIEPAIEFINEIKTHLEVIDKTVENLEPICPFIVFADLCDGEMFQNYFVKEIKNFLLDKALNKNISTDMIHLIQIIHSIKDVSNGKIGLIAMEMMDNYTALYRLYGKEDFIKYMIWGKYELIQLALKGYSQGDFHMGNILINKDYQNYFDGINGRAIIIDYGYALQIPNENLEIIKEYWKKFLEDESQRKYAYYKIFEQLFSVKKLNGLNLKSYPDYYGWVMQNDTNTYNEIYDLHLRREISINKIKGLYDNKDFSLFRISGGKDSSSSYDMEVYDMKVLPKTKLEGKTNTVISEYTNPDTKSSIESSNSTQNQIQKELFEYGNIMNDMVKNIEISYKKNNNNTFFEDFSKIMYKNTDMKTQTEIQTNKKKTKAGKRKNTKKKHT